MDACEVSRRIALVACALALFGCAGPNPKVISSELKPPQNAAMPYIASVVIRNTSGGEGQIEVTARLASRRDRTTAAEAMRNVNLKPHETVQVNLELRPARAGDYQLLVEAVYPP
jgi:hypothetical protein